LACSRVVEFFKLGCAQLERDDPAFLAPFCAGQRPVLIGLAQRLHRRQLRRFHHLPDQSIRHDEDEVAIAVGQIEGQPHQVDRFLHGRGREHDGMVIAMPGERVT